MTFLHSFDCLDEATYGKEGYGARASDVLIKVRGKDFRREKTKKKRGNYMGGRISMEVKSVRFDDSRVCDKQTISFFARC